MPKATVYVWHGRFIDVRELKEEDGALHDDKRGKSYIIQHPPFHETRGMKKTKVYHASDATGTTFEAPGPEMTGEAKFKGQMTRIDSGVMHTLIRWTILRQMKGKMKQGMGMSVAWAGLGAAVGIILIVIVLAIARAHGGV